MPEETRPENRPETHEMSAKQNVQIGILIAEQAGIGSQALETARMVIAITEAQETLEAAGELSVTRTERMLDCAEYGVKALEITLNAQNPDLAREGVRYAERAAEIAATLYERITDLKKTYLGAHKTIQETIPQLPGELREKLKDAEEDAERTERIMEENQQSARTALDLAEQAAQEAREALRRWDAR